MRLQCLVGPSRTSGKVVEGARTQEETEIKEMKKLADLHHFTCFPKDKLLAELGQAVVKRMVKRRGDLVYQMMAFNLPYFPRDMLEEVFPAESVIIESEKKISWELTTVDAIAQALTPLMKKSSYVCAGSTKAFRTRSERVIRVVAKLMPPLEVSHEVLTCGGERCYLNAMYLLATEEGELHYPKDNNRRELEIEPEMERRLRKEVLKDVRQLGNDGFPLSPSWWRQLGEDAKAQEVEKLLTEVGTPGLGKRHKRGKMKEGVAKTASTSTSAFEIDRIMSEKKVANKAKKMYLVRWAGYDAAWEEWRISGQPGEPIETWEPARLLQNTIALREWKESSRSS